MHYVKTGEKLYSDDPWTFTFSRDFNKNNDPLIVGGFGPGGPRVDSYLSTRLGVAGCRKFWAFGASKT